MDILLEEINKLKTLFIHLPGSNATSVQIWFRAGSALENQENQGIAHFLEHMFFKGTKKRPEGGLAKEVDLFGGEFNAFTSFDYTCYYINSPKANLVQSSDILIDMVSDPLFLEKDLPAEREVVFEEYKRSQDSPQQYNFQLIQRHSFPAGYRHPILGTQDTIKSFSLKQLKEFRNQYYSLANALIVVAGDLSDKNIKEQVIQNIKKHQLPTGKSSQFPKFKLNEEDKSLAWCHHKKVKQATLTIAFQAPEFESPETAAEDLAINCLGHGETSLLHQHLVKNSSLCSSTSASTMYFNHGGMHLIRLTLPEKNFSAATKALQQVLKKTLSNGFTPQELAKIKNQYIASKVYDYESIESLAFSFGHSFAQTGDIYSEQKLIERMKEVSLADVNQKISLLFSRPWHMHVQIPENAQIKPYLKMCQQFKEIFKKTVTSGNGFEEKNIYIGKKTWSDPMLKVQEVIPGITFIHRHNNQAPTFALQVYIKGGLADENNKKAGQHFLLSRCFTAGYGHRTALSLKKDLDFKSASLSGFSGKNAYGLMMHGLSEHFPELSQHFFGCLLNPTFDQKIFNLEKELTLRLIKNQQEDPTKRCFSLFQQLYFKKFPYGLDIYGQASTVKSFTTQNLHQLHQSHLKKDEMVVILTGNIDYELAFTMVQDQLLNLPKRIFRNFTAFKPSVKTDLEKFLPFDREQTHLFYALPAAALNTQEDLYLKILTAYLSGQSSELFHEMRDKRGLCYSVAPVHQHALQAGYWGIYMATSNEKLPLALAAIRELFEKLGKKGLSSDELERCKSMIAGQNILGLQTNEEFATYYAIPTLHGLGPDFEKTREEKIKNCSLIELNSFLKSFMQRKKILVQVGKKPLGKAS